MTKGDSRLETLLTSPHSFVNAALSPIYGTQAADATFAAVDQNPAQRAGVLTQAGILSFTAQPDRTSPTRRGKFVREQLMCQPPPPPPPNVDTNLPAAKPGETARQRYRTHVQDPACASCHTLIDPIGFGFESYDGIGRFRTVDNGAPVDASGEITGSRDLDGRFVGVPELARKLAGSEQVLGCVTRQWFEFATGREDDAGDAPALRGLAAGFRGGDLRALMLAIARSDAFRSRIVEVTP
jgi:hypothetical protein